MPRRLIFARNLSICKAKKDGVWIDMGAGIGHYLEFMSSDSYGLDLNEVKDKKSIVGILMMNLAKRT